MAGFSKFLYALPSAVALAIGGGGLFWATNGLRALTDEGARRYRVESVQPQITQFVLEDMQAQTISIGGSTDQLRPIIIIEFIYTSCPTICQAAGAYYAQLRDRIDEAGLGDQVKLLSVSFDPENDDISRLTWYGEFHNADGDIWTVTRIKSEDFERLKKNFGIVIIRDELGGFQHNAGMHILNNSGKLIAIHDLDDIDGVMKKLIN